MIAVILIAIAVLFILLAYDLNFFFQGEIEKKLANVKNPLRFRILLSIYLKNYFRVGKDKYGLFLYIYHKNSGEYWTKYQSLDVDDFNRARVYLDNLRADKRDRIKEERKKNLSFPRPREIYKDFVIY